MINEPSMAWLLVSVAIIGAAAVVILLTVVIVVPGLWREGLAGLRELLAKEQTTNS